MTTKAERNSTRNWRPALLTVEDMAYELRCGTTYVGELHEQGRLPAIKLGDKPTRWTQETVDNFIAGLPVQQPADKPMQFGVRKSNAGRRMDSSKK
jgi:excisionase family DNA binding protein